MVNTIKVPFSYGTVATPLTKAEGDSTHSWVAFVRFPEQVIDLKTIKRVTFKLHESFLDPLRCIRFHLIFSR